VQRTGIFLYNNFKLNIITKTDIQDRTNNIDSGLLIGCCNFENGRIKDLKLNAKESGSFILKYPLPDIAK
jgi:hypothetical protein